MAVSGILLACFFLSFPTQVSATVQFAERAGEPCGTCHVNEEGGELNPVGLRFAAGGFQWPIPEIAAPPLFHLGGAGRAVIGYLHVLFAFLWFGTILYVHLLLRPAYAAQGLPHGEVRLGAVSMVMVGVTGLLLTLSRVGSLAVFFQSRWGILLGIKITLYLVMISSAFVVVNFIGPRLKRGMKEAEHPADGVFGPDTLSAFDGREGRPAFIAHEGKVYDVTGKMRWAGGVHFRHKAGIDQTAELPKAPHGPEKLEGAPAVGTYDASRRPPLTPAQKVFYFVAYMNFALVFLVLLVIAFWRWWV